MILDKFDFSDDTAEDRLYRRTKMLISKTFSENCDYILQLDEVHNKRPFFTEISMLRYKL